MHLHQLIYLGLLPSFAAATSDEWIVGQPVNTTSGRLVGHSSPWKPLVSEYLGVRFAKPPTGSLRFAPPEAFTSEDDFEAAHFSNSCPSVNLSPENSTVRYGSPQETHFDGLRQLGETFDEDCLALNVWTKPQSGEGKKAVLVWIYGGSFTGGSSTWPLYNGAQLADEHDVVVVSINYRLTIFGYPLAEAFDDKNPGLLDMRLAIEWVRENIEQFGGDTSRITLAGQSAGAGAIDNYAYIYPEDPIAHAIITQSGNSIGGSGPQEAGTQGWLRAAAELGCPTDDDEKVLECMRDQTWQDLAVVAVKAAGWEHSAALGVPGFALVADNKTFFPQAEMFRKMTAGEFAKLPMLTGYNNNEGGLWEMIDKAEGKDAPEEGYGSHNLLFRCGQVVATLARSAHGVPIWVYEYAGEFPNVDVGVEGAWHGAEIPMVFGTTELTWRRADTAPQKELSQYMGKAWTDFAKDPLRALPRLGWQPAAVSFPRLGGDNSSAIVFENSTRLAVGCEAILEGIL
ncbi:carboxylesterase [Plectosphaerella plurivora]|uniref:Carboxylic ester hydrolase n=1 Tax=Plectosphaerella plurivora TaxID=936078 RepID=A0A9P8V661_9PEZI|nr:carboxylesterase [Plectosphaerella plurivora]